MKTVLLFRSSFCRSNLLEHEGVFRFAKAHDWRIQTVEYMNAAQNRYRVPNDAAKPDVKSLIDIWHPDGCIAECGIAPRVLSKRDFGKTPVVFLDRDPDTVERGAVCVYSDSTAIASAAARELLQLELDEFAFIGWPDPVSWSENRGRSFESIIRKHGKNVRLFRIPKTEKPESDLHRLGDFLMSLKKPCGLFTANDVLAKQVMMACARLGLAIPDDLALVSVDSDEDICERSFVTITSLQLDFLQAGVEAAEQLDLMMSEHADKAASSLFGVDHIVRRKSAIGRRNLDKRMSNALEFIRLHACGKITVPDVVREMGCSRRFADLRFRAALNRTITDEIHLNRLDVAKTLLLHGEPIDAVAGKTGYASAADFRRVFKRYTGVSPKRWTKTEKPNKASFASSRATALP